MTRRVVRVAPEFFLALDAQLPDGRGPRGEPTAAEFAASELLLIVEAFALRWDDLLQPIPGRDDYRDLILTMRLVPFVVVRGQLSPLDGAVELIDIEVDLVGLSPEPDRDDSD
ncbi:MAG TPA: hypothetical protein VE781_13800 [Kineosporiaceae bacterium]|nr:hypothetical protein [Kineosporiaceae bacterium]